MTQGYEKKLEIVGTGYRVVAKGSTLEFALGYSHPITVEPPEGITFAVEAPTRFTVTGIDKQQVGEVAANIRKLRKPDPYKGKGVRYAGEQIHRKVGKAGKKSWRSVSSAAVAARQGQRRRPRAAAPAGAQEGRRHARPSAAGRHPVRPARLRPGRRRHGGRTLASASTMEADLRGLDGDKTAKAKRVGELVAERAKAAGSRPWSSTVAATSTTAGSPRSPTAPARAGCPCDRRDDRACRQR